MLQQYLLGFIPTIHNYPAATPRRAYVTAGRSRPVLHTKPSGSETDIPCDIWHTIVNNRFAFEPGSITNDGHVFATNPCSKSRAIKTQIGFIESKILYSSEIREFH